MYADAIRHGKEFAEAISQLRSDATRRSDGEVQGHVPNDTDRRDALMYEVMQERTESMIETLERIQEQERD